MMNSTVPLYSQSATQSDCLFTWGFYSYSILSDVIHRKASLVFLWSVEQMGAVGMDKIDPDDSMRGGQL